MAIELGDILLLTDVQQYLSQTVLNTYTYRVDALGGSAGYPEIVEAWNDQVLPEIAEVQHPSLVHTGVTVRNLSNGLDIYEMIHAVPGELTPGEATPSFTAWSFRLVRATALTRHGAKRLAGPTEGFLDGNSVNPAVITQLTEAGAAMAAPVVVTDPPSGALTVTPVIVGRFPKGHPDAGGYDLSKINDIVAGQFIRVSTQTTRRAGRGV